MMFWLLLSGCSSESKPSASLSGVDSSSDTSSQSAEEPSQPESEQPDSEQDSAVPTEAEAPYPRVYRLSHSQWENSIQALFPFEEARGLSDAFLGDGLHEGFDNNAESLQIGPVLFQDYQGAAERLAAMVVENPEHYALVVPEDPRENGGGVAFSQQWEAEHGHDHDA